MDDPGLTPAQKNIGAQKQRMRKRALHRLAGCFGYHLQAVLQFFGQFEFASFVGHIIPRKLLRIHSQNPKRFGPALGRSKGRLLQAVCKMRANKERREPALLGRL